MRKKWHWSKSTGWRQGEGWRWGECGDKGETKGVVKGEGREKEEVQGKNEGETEGVGAGKSEGEGREKSEGEGDGRVKGDVCTKLLRKLLRLPKLKASNLWQDPGGGTPIWNRRGCSSSRLGCKFWILVSLRVFRAKRQYFKPPRSRLGFHKELEIYDNAFKHYY